MIPDVPEPPGPPAEALRRATLLSGQARRSTRWYRSYLLVFAAGSFALSVLMGALRGPYGVLTTTLLWGAFLLLTTLWISRKQTAIRGMTRLQAVVMVSWGLVWGADVILGEHYFATSMSWWLLGGLAVAAPPAVGAYVAHRRTA